MSLQGRGRVRTKPHSICKHVLHAAEGSAVGSGFPPPFFFALMSYEDFSLLYNIHIFKPDCPGSTG